MNLDAVIEGFELPAAARVDRRVPKKLLADNSPRRVRVAIEQGIEQLRWVAVLKPGNTAIPTGTFHPSDGDPVPVAEVSVLVLALREDARSPEAVEVVHRAVPYHILLLAEQAGQIQVSVAWKRRSLTQADQFVLLDGPLVAPACEMANMAAHQEAFLAHLALGQQPGRDLAQVYQGWASAVLAAQAALITGQFRPLADAAANLTRQSLLAEHGRLVVEIAGLASRLRQATQVRDRVELGYQLKQAEAGLDRLRSLL